MPIHHDTPENPSAQEPYFEKKTAPFTDAAGTHPVNDSVGTEVDGKPTDEIADDPGGLVDPQDDSASGTA